MAEVRVQTESFDAGAELNSFSEAQDGAGAVVSFTGVVRDVAGGLNAMEIEHYPGMTEKAISGIVEHAKSRWPLTGALVIHRYGRLEPGAQIMMVATASAHRLAAFEAAEFLMDYLKSRAPFWKKEVARDGAGWVAAVEADEDALKRW
ncbi:molybdenum cofactor biosynthesis protein MoaE [Vannielia litorea]|uniref:molybdenum cofactor biosynthesis protein MoaE n=1 Tax=Vannielia litorea TaxID=1217970 RepID=UPI001C953848|nr:molybdenum cofactor biosynthesis protein MoaE [Vannielia litorea]MBY6049264.1 molybdenum cofactor biosynthesis protein MoaE [Vannielia litorea]MBY6076678.1 molybdenum cofactor biosynthesis protein MoaE [Vannielia litorea]